MDAQVSTERDAAVDRGNHLRGPRHILTKLVRRAIAITAVAAIAATLAFLFESNSVDEYESVARVAFVEDTRFDYLQAERDRLVGFVEDFVAGELLDEDIVGVDFIRPDRETFIDVIVRGTDPEVTRDLANSIADRIVLADRGVRTESISAELSARRVQLKDMDDQLAVLAEEIAVQSEREAFAEANRFEGDASDVERLTIQLRTAQDRLFLAVRYRNSVVDSQLRTADRIDELEIALDLTEAETRVVRPALPASEPLGPAPVTVAFIAGMAALALGVLVVAVASTEQADL